jgi:hypothetical protein
MRSSSLKTAVTAVSIATLLSLSAPIAEARPAERPRATRAGAPTEPRQGLARLLRRLVDAFTTNNTEPSSSTTNALPSVPIP